VLEPARDAKQELVADGVAEAVVDVFETVEVEEEDREMRRRTPLHVCQGAGQAIDEEHPVRKPRQPVVEGVMLELVLGPLSRRDVGLRAGHAVRLTALVSHRHPSRQHPQILTGGVAHPMLELELLGGAREVGGEVAAERRPIVGVDAVDPLARAVPHILDSEPEHRLPPG